MEKEIISIIKNATRRTVIALDGRSASGKTTLAQKIKDKTNCAVVHMDDFFVKKERRRSEVGGNIDFERLITDVLIPFKNGEKVIYRPFLCKKGEMGEEVVIEGIDSLILEGAYSTHTLVEEFLDFSFFLDISKEEQLERIRKRNPDNFEDFINIWIPREEEYFKSKKNGFSRVSFRTLG